MQNLKWVKVCFRLKCFTIISNNWKSLRIWILKKKENLSCKTGQFSDNDENLKDYCVLKKDDLLNSSTDS